MENATYDQPRQFLVVGHRAGPDAALLPDHQTLVALLLPYGAVNCLAEHDLPAAPGRAYTLIVVDAGRVADAPALLRRLAAVWPRARLVVAADFAGVHWSHLSQLFEAGAAHVFEPAAAATALPAALALVDPPHAPALNADERAPRPFRDMTTEEKQTMKIKLLFADNNVPFLKRWAKFLEDNGCHVIPAYSPREAIRILNTQHVHLAVIDYHLEDDEDAHDRSGLNLAKRREFAAIPKLILTRLPTPAKVIEALEEREGLPPAAVKFVSKLQDPDDPRYAHKTPEQVLLDEIRATMRDKVRLNETLTIDAGDYSLGGLRDDLEGKLPVEQRVEFDAELDDVMRKVFYHEARLVVERRLSAARDTVLLDVTALDAQGFERSYLLAVRRRPDEQQADLDALAAINAAHGWNVAAAIGDNKPYKKDTRHYEAVAFRRPGVETADLTPLTDFYQRHSADEIAPVIDDLYGRTLAELHRQDAKREAPSRRQAMDAALARLGAPPGKSALLARANRLIERAAGLVPIEANSQRLTFDLDGVLRDFPNPLPGLFDRGIRLPVVPYGRIHGHLDAAAVLVDSRGHSHLIAHAPAERGPLVLDFATLELSVRLHLLRDEPPAGRWLLEERLLATALGDDPDLAGLSAEARRAALVISRIRRAAARLPLDRDAYFEWLLIAAAARLAAINPDVSLTRRELLPPVHLLLLAAVLGQRLARPVRDSAWRELIELDLDQPGGVYVQGRRVELTDNEYQLICLLLERRNKNCTYEDIARLLNYPLPDKLPNGRDDPGQRRAMRTNVHQVASTLRDKLGDVGHILINVRNQGYRLNLPE